MGVFSAADAGKRTVREVMRRLDSGNTVDVERPLEELSRLLNEGAFRIVLEDDRPAGLVTQTPEVRGRLAISLGVAIALLLCLTRQP